MIDQTDNLLYALVYSIPGCEQISELRARYPDRAKQLLKKKEDFYLLEYGRKAYENVSCYVNEPFRPKIKER